MDTRRKLIILADAAKCDASCAHRLRVPVAKVLPFMALPDDPPRDGGRRRLRRQVRLRADASAGASIGAGERQPDLFA